MTIYYVYAYLRTHSSTTAAAGTPYYIGKGKGNRAYDPRHSVKLPKDKQYIVFLETGLTEVGALALERRLISWWGRVDKQTGILRNRTDGGDGASGRIVNQNTRMLLRQASLGHTRGLGKIFTQERKDNISLAKKGIRTTLQTPEIVAKNIATRRKNGTLARTEQTKEKLRKPKTIIACPHCDKTGGSSQMKRWHFSNCKKILTDQDCLV